MELKNLAIIMDGNGRWAKQKNLPRFKGHEEGVKRIIDICKYVVTKTKIKSLTLFAFSIENWKRSFEEVNFLMNIINKINCTKLIKELNKFNIKLKVIGTFDKVSNKIIKKIELIEKKTINNFGLLLVIAFSYSGKQEIIDAANRVFDQNIPLTIKNLTNNLSSFPITKIDLLIRTSGELRVSNFLLWQLAYAEFYFTKVLWPSFTIRELKLALDDYQIRERRFGKVYAN